MRKLRSDSRWSKLPTEQLEQITHWLFEEGMGYEAVVDRVQKEFGIKASKSSLHRYFHHVAEKRELAGLNLPPTNPEQFRAATIKLLGMATLNAAIDHRDPGANKRFISMVKLLLQDQQRELNSQWLDLKLKALSAAKTGPPYHPNSAS